MKIKRNSLLLFCGLVTFTMFACSTTQTSSGSETPHQQYESQNANPTANEAKTSVDIFDLTTINAVPPTGILEEIEYYGQGGRDCYDPTYPKVKVDFPPTDEELMTESMLISCGWKKDEIVTGTITYPNGKSFSQTIQLEEDMSGDAFAAKLRFKPTLDDPTGTYAFTIEGESGIVSAQANFRAPNGPHIFSINTEQIILYGFSPEEAIRLYCYDITNGKFIGWKEYKVEVSGHLILNVPANKCNFAAIGPVSGEVHSVSYHAHGGSYDWVDYQLGSIRIRVYCDNLPSRVDIGDHARVAYTNGANMRIRQEPGFTQTILGKVPEGTQITILDGPTCADESTWWKVRTDNGQEGWMAEYQSDAYLLERLP